MLVVVGHIGFIEIQRSALHCVKVVVSRSPQECGCFFTSGWFERIRGIFDCCICNLICSGLFGNEVDVYHRHGFHPFGMHEVRTPEAS